MNTESIPDILDRQREEQEYLAKFRAMRSEKDAFDQCTAERMEYEAMLATHTVEAQARSDFARELLKQMRFALNAFNDGCPQLACEILGDALRKHGEEQP